MWKISPTHQKVWASIGVSASHWKITKNMWFFMGCRKIFKYYNAIWNYKHACTAHFMCLTINRINSIMLWGFLTRDISSTKSASSPPSISLSTKNTWEQGGCDCHALYGSSLAWSDVSILFLHWSDIHTCVCIACVNQYRWATPIELEARS